jgi:anhydro-N-acetylmuramic acid kinase
MTLGDAAWMSNALGIPVVHKFREADVAAGGQGAPFAPLYHHVIAVKADLCPVGIINAGGIANVTIIPSADETAMMAYDTGPANALIDALVRLKTNGAQTYDRDGGYAKQGVVSADVLALLFEKAVVKNGQNYFDMAPPKSLDTGDMVLLPEVLALSLEDGCATLAAFTAQSIVQGLTLYMAAQTQQNASNTRGDKGPATLPKRWILAGGGWKNPAIREFFDEALTAVIGDCEINTADEMGWKGDAMEANIFAYLAVRSLHGKPLSLPNTTGVPTPQTGGQIALPQQRAA